MNTHFKNGVDLLKLIDGKGVVTGMLKVFCFNVYIIHNFILQHYKFNHLHTEQFIQFVGYVLHK